MWIIISATKICNYATSDPVNVTFHLFFVCTKLDSFVHRYRNNMKKLSAMFKERPEKPLDTALWWTNFVLRHSQEDLATLRPLIVSHSWWKRRQLDVWLTITVSIITIWSSLTYLMYILLKCTCSSKTSSATIPHKKRERKKVQ